MKKNIWEKEKKLRDGHWREWVRGNSWLMVQVFKVKVLMEFGETVGCNCDVHPAIFNCLKTVYNSAYSVWTFVNRVR